MNKHMERELMQEIGAAALLEDAGLTDVTKATDRADASGHGSGGGYTALTRTYGGSPHAKLALNTLASIASEIAIGYPNGVDAGMVDLTGVDHRTVTTFKEALPYLDASRGDNYQGYSGLYNFGASAETIAREQEMIAKLKALNAAEKVVENAVVKNGKASQEALDKLESLRLTPAELTEARAMQAEAFRQAAIKAKQCSNEYYQDLLDQMHIILTYGKSEMHNSVEGVEERAADAFVAKLRTNAKLLARSLSPDAAAYIEANTCDSEMDDIPQRRSTGPRQKGKY